MQMTAEEFEGLRELYLNAPQGTATRVVGIVMSATVLLVVLFLVRRRVLREEYTPIWVVAALGMAAMGFSAELLRSVARLIGAWTASSAILFFGVAFLIAVCLNYAVRLSRHGMHLKNLGQENAILRARLEELELRFGEARPDEPR
jgi:tellurite resistance protein TehA-like permease